MGTTTFRLRHGSPIAPDLDDLPYLLRSSSDTAATVIVTPTDPTLDEAERAMQLAVLLGGRGRAATVATADAALEAGAEATHLVLIGTPGRQPLLAEYHRALPLGGTVPDRWPTDIEIQLGGVRHGASVQLAATAQDGVLLAVTGERDSDVIAALDALLDADLRSQLVGTMALVSSDPLNTISVRFDGLVPTSTVDRSSSAADRIEPVADASDDRATAATAAVAPAPGADRAPARRRTELVLIALGVAVLAGAVYALRRFGFTRPASSTLG